MAAPERSEGASRRAIEYHYDVGGDFYGLWLDSRRVYSCALWNDSLDDDLERAQVAKLDWHADALGDVRGGRVLDVGCGWGAMLRHLVSERGVARATGLTLSADQAAFAADYQHVCAPHTTETAADPSTEVLLEDWRRHTPAAPYDGIVSIGALEHFTRADLTRPQRQAVYRSWFDSCAGWLVDGGRLSLQAIGYEDLGADPDSEGGGAGDTGAVSSFFVEEIFPESELPHLSDLVAAAEPTFRILALRSDASHYEHTLRLWQGRLETNRDAAVALVGRDRYRRYLRYLRVSRAMFDRRVCTLYRLVLERRPSPEHRGAPGRAPR